MFLISSAILFLANTRGRGRPWAMGVLLVGVGLGSFTWFWMSVLRSDDVNQWILLPVAVPLTGACLGSAGIMLAQIGYLAVARFGMNHIDDVCLTPT